MIKSKKRKTQSKSKLQLRDEGEESTTDVPSRKMSKIYLRNIPLTILESLNLVNIEPPQNPTIETTKIKQLNHIFLSHQNQTKKWKLIP